MAQLSIQREIDLMITTANHYIDYMNKKIHYGQFVELAMREFAKSQVNQNLSYVKIGYNQMNKTLICKVLKMNY